jgi:hypothetical protein
MIKWSSLATLIGLACGFGIALWRLTEVDGHSGALTTLFVIGAVAGIGAGIGLAIQTRTGRAAAGESAGTWIVLGVALAILFLVVALAASVSD